MRIEIQLSTFYGRGDERRFFQGLSDLDCVKNVKGVGRGLVFDVNLNRLSKEKLFELLALLWRYQIDLAPFRRLAETNKRFAWLGEPHFYWHANMYAHPVKNDT